MSNINLDDDLRPGDDIEVQKPHHQMHHAEPKRDDSTDTRKMSILLWCLIGSLVLFGILVYINQQTGFLSTKDLAYYQYSNGDETFNVKKVIRDLYVGWQVEMVVNEQPYILELYNDPASLEDIPTDRAAKANLLDDKVMYVTWEPNTNRSLTTAFAFAEINKVVDNPDIFGIPVNLSKMSPYKNDTVKTCADATKASSVIWLKLGTETSVSMDGNCVIVQGTNEDEILRAADRLVFLLLGIMK